MDFLHRKTNLCFLSKRYAARMIENAAQKGGSRPRKRKTATARLDFFVS
jgi:hypothetical protein